MGYQLNCDVLSGERADKFIMDAMRGRGLFFCITHMKVLADVETVEKHMQDKSKFGNWKKQYEKERRRQGR